MKKLNIFPSSNPIIFIIFLLSILIKFSTLSFENVDQIFPVVKNLKTIKNSPIHCSCHKHEELSKMVGVQFSSGNKYLISPQLLGEGATAMVFHAIYVGQKWKMTADMPTNCVAIKMADPSCTPKNERVAKELAILIDIFPLHNKYSKLSPPNHILSFIRNESFMVKNKNIKHSVIIMELGKQNLYEYWKAMPQFCQCHSFLLAQFCQKCTDDTEIILLYIMHEISLGLHQLHQRNYIFIDLKPQNVMIMPNSPNPKEIYDGNYGRLQIKLTDFGAALKFAPDKNGKQKLSTDEREHLMCTPFYWAPELIDVTFDDADEISPKTDIYSLGRLMLMLAVQTPQIKNFWKEFDKNFEENVLNWINLLVDMLEAVEILPAPTNMDEIPENIFDSDSDVEGNNEITELEKEEKKKEAEEKEKEKKKDEKYKKNLIELYGKMKKNFGHLMEIISGLKK